MSEALPESLLRGHAKDTTPGRNVRAAPAQISLLSKPKKKGVSEVSANRGCELTNWVPARNSFAEANICDFEILSGIPVNAETIFAGENGPYCRITASLRLRRMNCSLAPAEFGHRLANLKLSDSPRSYAQPVDCHRFHGGPFVSRASPALGQR